MYGLKESTDIGFFANLEVIQVCLGLFQVQIHFEEQVSLYIEGRFVHDIAEGKVSVAHERGILGRESRLGRLLGARVEEAHVIADGATSLTFSNGDCLVVLDDSEQYESYQIKSQNGLIVV